MTILLNLKNFTIMKKFMVLAIVALVSVAMISCGGEKKNEKKAECNKECTTCPDAATCPNVQTIDCCKECHDCPVETQTVDAAEAKADAMYDAAEAKAEAMYDAAEAKAEAELAKYDLD